VIKRIKQTNNHTNKQQINKSTNQSKRIKKLFPSLPTTYKKVSLFLFVFRL